MASYMQIKTQAQKLIVCASLLAAGTALAVDRTWDGGAGTTLLNTAANWSGDTVPAVADTGSWDGTVQTNVPYVWNAQFGPGSGQNAASYFVRSAYTSPIQLYTTNGAAGANLLVISNLTLEAGSGPFTLGSNGVICGVAFRANGTNLFVNNSANAATWSTDLYLNSGGGVGRTISFGGSGSWVINGPWNLQSGGSGVLNLLVEGTGANTLTLNSAANVLSGTDRAGSVTINAGTLMLTHGDALGAGVAHTVNIGGGGGVRTLALTNDISLNPVVNNINIAGRNDTSGSGNAAILNVSGNNSINGTVRFNAAGGTNIVIHNNTGGVLNLNSNVTAANVTADRYVHFNGPGDTIVNGPISNGSAVLAIVQGDGTLTLNGTNTHTGRTILNGGVLNMGNEQALASTSVEVNGGKLNINGGTLLAPRIGGLSGSGVVDTVSGGTPVLSVGNNNVSSSFAGNLTNSSGILTLNKIGTGTFTMSGAGGYSGGTVVSNGTLLINNTVGSGTGSGSVTVVSAATLGGTGIIQGAVDWQLGSAARFTVTPTNAVGSNATPMTVSGALTLNGNAVTVNVAGGTPLSPGTYKLMDYTGGASGAFAVSPTYTGAGVELGTASSISTSGGVVTLTVIFTGVVTTWTNNGDGNWTTGANWSSSPYYPQVAGDSATLGVGSAFTTVTLNSNLSVGTLIFTNENSFLVASAGNTLTLGSIGAEALINVSAGSSNAIAVPVALTTNLTIARAASTVIALTNTIANSGGTRTLTLTGNGTLALSGNNSYGPAAGTVGTTVNGGVVELGHNNALGAGDVNLTASSTLRALTGLTVANNLVDGTGTATVDNNGNSVTLTGVISGGGALTKNGNGTLTLSSSNSYAGNTTINAGTVVLANGAGIPGGTNRGNVTLGDGVTLNLNGNSVVLNGLNSTTNTAVVDSLTGGAVTLTLGESGAFGTFLGDIKNTSGSLTLVKNGAGTQTLAGNNTYTGGTTINAGTLQIGNGGTTGNLGSGTLLNDGNLQFNLAGTNVFTGGITGTGTVTLANTSLSLWLTGNNTFTGNVINNSGTLWITNAASLGVGPKTVTAVGGGVSLFTQLRLAGNVTIGPDISFLLSYNGGVLVNDSGSNTIQGPIGMPNGGGNPLIIASNGFLTLAGDIATVTGNNARTLTLDGPANGMVSGNISDSSLPQVSVTKNGSGTWTLSGAANIYTGATTVNGGTLLVNGAHYGTGVFTNNIGGTLGGKGDGSTTGVISSAVVYQPGSSGKFFVSSGGATPLTVYGNVTLNNNAIEVHVEGGTPLPPGSYVLLAEGNTVLYSITGAFSTTPVITGAGLQSGTIASVSSSSTQVILTVANTSTWTSGVNGNWTTGANWSSNPQFPDAAGEFANLGVGASLITINLDASQTVGGVSFTNENSFVITNANNTLTLNNSGNNAVVTVTAGASNAISSKISLGDNAVVSSSPGAGLFLSGDIDGAAGMTFTGNGVVKLTGSNTFSGNATLSGGTLTLGSTNAVGSGTLTITGGTLDSSVPNLVNANDNAQSWNGSFTFLGSQNLNLGNGAVNSSSTEKTVTVSSNSLTVNGVVSGSGRIIKAGNGTLVLTAANGGSLTGGMRIDAGTVAIGDDAALGSGTIEFGGAGATIQSTDSTARTVTNSMNLSFGGIYAGTSDLNFTGPLASGSFPKTIVVSNAVTTFSGVLAGGTAQDAANTKAGPGKLILTGDNSAMAKKTAINEGTLALGSATAIGTGLLTINGGGLDSTVVDLVNAGNNAQTWAGSFYFVGTENLNLGTGGVTLSTNTTLTISNKILTVGGNISGAANALTKSGAGTLVLSGTNSYGNTTVQAGTLEIALATLATNSTVAVSNSAVLQLNFSTTNQVAGLTLNGVAQPAGVYNNTTPGGYLAGPGALLVVPLGPSGPAQLTNSYAGGVLSLSWPAGQGWRLQAQTNSRSIGLSNNWVYETDGSVSSTNITVDATQPTVFFRLVYP